MGLKKSAPNTTDEEFNTAQSRGNRASNLFPAGNKDTMKAIVKALKQEDLHVAQPDIEDSGYSDFFQECSKVIPLNIFPGKDQPTQEAERAAFINDLWNTALAARKAQEQRPCW